MSKTTDGSALAGVHWPDFSRDWTLKSTVGFEGQGLHSGQQSRVKIVPRDQPGLYLRQGSARWAVNISELTGTHLSTSLGGLRTVEHLLAALWGLGVSCAEIMLEGPEMPALDGSAAPFVEACLQVGLTALQSPRAVFRPHREVSFELEGARVLCRPAEQLEIHYQIDFAAVNLQQAYCWRYSPLDFCHSIAPARTFALAQDIEALQASGYALGGSLENALVLEPLGYRNRARFPDEPVRHKILDCVGDLSLLGRHVQAHIEIQRGGHRSHAKLVEILAAQIGDPPHDRCR